MKLTEFLKPDLKKIIVLLILLLPLTTFSLPSLPPQLDIINMFFKENYMIAFPSVMTACFLGGYDCGGWRISEPIAYLIIFSITILFWYFVSCIIISVWNRCFNTFGEKKNRYEKIAVKYLVILFVLIAIIIPVIGSFLVAAEIKTRKGISVDEVFRSTYPIGTNLQEIKLRNHFFLPISYKLPDVTFCIYDADENFKIGDLVFYRTEDGKYIADMDKYHRNVIVVSPFGETKVYLNRIGGNPMGKGYEKFKNYSREKYDEILLLTNVGMNNYNYCYDAKEEDIVVSEKIKILK